MDSRIYWIWLSRALPMGDSQMNRLLDAFGTARAVYESSPDTIREKGLPESLCRRLEDRSLEEARRIFERAVQKDDWILTPEDALYPSKLRHLASGCPAVLYCRGTLPDLDVEGAAHRGALSVGGTTIVVMACELNGSYPAESADIRRMAVQHGGLLVSEFPPGWRSNCIYPVRNRLMVGLSQGVLLGQTPQRSGARITARIAREEGADVFALPASILDPHGAGCNEEIRSGAALIRGAGDILEEYAVQFPGMLDVEAGVTAERQEQRRPMPATPRAVRRERKAQQKRIASTPSRPHRAKPTPEETAEAVAVAAAETAACPPAASDTARRVWDTLTDAPCPVDELAQKTRLPVSALLAALTELEMLGAAGQQAGQQYVRK